MIYFRNDYGAGCIEPIMKLLQEYNDGPHFGYGEDELCKRAAEVLQSKFPDTPSDIYFITTGTLTNIVMVKHSLRQYYSVIAVDTSHIVAHEAGAIEATGRKILQVENVNGKVTPAAIQRVFDQTSRHNRYRLLPKVVFISNATELGTVYTRAEMEALSAKCHELDLYLVMDGARIGPAIMSGVDYTLNDIAKWCDMFSVGGTKSGGLLGEAVCITNPELKKNFLQIQKQCGAMLSKSWLMGIQFIGLFQNDDFYTNAKKANDMAMEIQDKIIELGYPLFMKSTTNQIFFLLTQHQYDYLKERVSFEIWDKWGELYIVRIVTSWHTTQEEVDYLKVYLTEAMEQELKPEEAAAAVIEEAEKAAPEDFQARVDPKN